MFDRQKKYSTRAPKKLVAGKFHTAPAKPAPEKRETAPKPKAVRRAIPFEEIKRQLEAWAEDNRIPGKFQAWFTRDAVPDHSDWRILNKLVNNHESLTIEPPAYGMVPPALVKSVFDQLHKEHLHTLKKAMRQIWFRATGDGRYALLVQANIHGRNSGHEIKSFVEFLQHSCPQVISCHQVQCTPSHLFDPALQQNMRVEVKTAFGSAFMPIAGTGLSMHVLDWTPRIKDAWLELPLRIRDAIHPAREDRFFEFYSASGFVSASLAQDFMQVEALDCRETAMESAKMNARNAISGNMHFHRSHLDRTFLEKFFSRRDNEGKWTFYLNEPEAEPLTSELVQAIAASRPERILLQVSDLENAAKQIKRFRTEGYMLRKNIPLYLEPGSGKFELLMLFVPDRAGLLGGFMGAKGQNRAVKRPQERISGKNQGDTPHFVQKKVTFRQRKD